MYRVVIVDDDEATLKLYSAVIKRVQGEPPIAFSDARTALVELENLRASLVIVDYLMPEMDGVDFTRALRRQAGHALTPVLMLTAHGDQTLGPRALDAGATACIEKPLSIKDFSAQVRRFATIHPPSRSTFGEVVMPTDERDTIERLHRTMRTCNRELAISAEQVRDLAVAIAEQLHLSPVEIEALRTATLVYDIGMLSVPDRVRSMPSALPLRWRSVVNGHVDAGAVILGGATRPLLRTAETIARYHHERYDGTGYPDGLAGEDIPIFARIVAVADTFVALTSERPHRIEFTTANALAQIRGERNKAFDPAVVDAFARLEGRLGEFRRTA
ncbi:MAG TPA: HD domain-containing phosphohydrolase [Candidatus Baltobacteraceae bacterium]|nr:HD domain-containing phosphohydrolase [Candidatus Baltobacteraceae bacterium]